MDEGIVVAEHNWCDRRCERCVLSDRCALALREEQMRWRHRMRGDDPDDPEICMRDVMALMEDVLTKLQEIVEEEGIDLEELEQEEGPPPLLDEARMKKLGVAHGQALLALRDAVGEGTALDEVRQWTMVFAPKLVRVAPMLGPEEEREAVRHDAVPNLLLIEWLDRHIASVVEEVAGARGLDLAPFRSARSEILRFVRPLLEEVPPGARDDLDARIRAGRAPSPFVRRTA